VIKLDHDPYYVFDSKKRLTIENNIVRKRFPVAAYYLNELTCLKLLKKNFINTTGINHFPFPEIISHSTTYGLLYEIKMSYCGIPAFYNNAIKPKNLKNTVQCICDNLKYNNFLYKDFNATNICIDRAGAVYLIDFEECIPKIKPHLKDIISEYYEYPKDIGEYNKMPLTHKAGVWKKRPWSMLYMFKHV